MDHSLDQVLLNFDKGSLTLLNVCIAFIMFGVALELKLYHFRQLFRTPKSILIGLFSQLLLLPAVTWLLIVWLQPVSSMALGMLLVASCPGGNVSNFYCALSGGNVALSVSLTALSSTLSTLFTPLSFALWAGLYEPTAGLLQSIDLDIWEMIRSIMLVLALPLSIGMILSEKLPSVTQVISKPIKRLSILLFVGFVAMALIKNLDQFMAHIGDILFIVAIHNGLALLSGYGISTIMGLPSQDRRSITLETGIQNVSIALVIVFDFFHGLGGMAFVAAWWGVWHLVAGGTLSYVWSRVRPIEGTG